MGTSSRDVAPTHRSVAGGLRLLIILMGAVLMAFLLFSVPASAQQASVDYDTDDDGLIEIDSLAKLNAIRWDLNGDGAADSSSDQASYDAAFPNPAAGMGCAAVDPGDNSNTPAQPICHGYELTVSLSLDEDGDGDIDSDDASYWNGGRGWDPLGGSAAFTGVFKGNDNTIDYLFIDRPSVDNVGLFGAIDGVGNIADLHLTNVDVTGGHYVGALVGYIQKGIVIAVAGSGTVSGRQDVGGLVGGTSLSEIEASSFDGTVTVEKYYGGGLVGLNYGVIRTSSSSAAVSGNFNTGGLVGANGYEGLIVSSYASGSVSANYHAGGLTSQNFWKAAVRDSYATGAVRSHRGAAGGLVGINSYSSDIRSSYSSGEVDGNHWAGGFVGANYGSISDSYSSGRVTGTRYAGGLAAENAADGRIRRSYAAGEVRLTDPDKELSAMGGLLAFNDRAFKVSDSYWDTTVSLQVDSVGGAGHTTAELQNPTSASGIYASWNPDLWEFGASDQYPTLKVDLDGDGSATSAEFGSQYTNRAPVFQEGNETTRQVMEGTPADVNIGDPVSAIDSYGGVPLVYSLGSGSDEDHFDIDAASGQIKTKGALDHENASSYEVTVTVTDGSLADSILVIINVVDIADPADKKLPSGPILVRWDADARAVPSTFYSLRRRLDAPGSPFLIIVQRIRENSMMDLDRTVGRLAYRDDDDLADDQQYRYDVRAFHGDGSKSEWTAAESAREAALSKMDVVEDTSIEITVAENKPVGAALASAFVPESLAEGEQIYALAGLDHAYFAVDDGGQLRVKIPLDYETKTTYEVTITATDRLKKSAVLNIIIKVTDVPDILPGQPAAPKLFDVQGSSFRVNWQRPMPGDSEINGIAVQYKRQSQSDRAYRDVIHDPTIFDPDRSVRVFQIRNQVGQSVSPGVSYDVRVRERNTAGWGPWSDVASVTTLYPPGKPKPPTFSNVKGYSFRVKWKAPKPGSRGISDYVLQYKPSSASDSAYVYTWPDHSGARRSYDLKHHVIGNSVKQIITPGTSYDVRVRAWNGIALGPWSEPGTVTTLAAPGKPKPPTFGNIQHDRFQVAWDTPSPGASPITGYDVQLKPSSGPDHHYKYAYPPIRGDANICSLVSMTGNRIVPETSYDVRVRALSAIGPGPWSDASTVTTTAADDAAAAQGQSATTQDPASAHTVPAKPAAPTFTAIRETRFRIVWTAPAAGSSAITGYDIEYKLSSESDDEYRDVKPAPRGTKVTGFNLTTRGGQSIVAGTSYDVRVRAKNDDGWGEWSDAGTVTTAGTSLPAAAPPAQSNRPPAFSDAAITLSVAEDAAAGTAIGDAITATDPDGDTLAYRLGTTADDGHFAIDSKSGQLSVKGALDYESGASYTVSVTATDPDGFSTSVAVTISVTDVNEAPAFASDVDVDLDVAENTAAGTAIGDAITATDPDGDTLAYRLGTTADDGHFAIDSKSGQISTSGALDYESDASYTVTVTGTDPDGLSASVAVTISVSDVADAPPGKPAAPTFTAVRETSFRIKWTAPEAGSSLITGYDIEYKLSSEADDEYRDVKPAPRGTKATGFNLTTRGGQSIVAGTSYDVRVRAENAHGWGEWSDAGTVTTAGTAHTVPAKPAAPTFTAVQETRFRIVWTAPSAGASLITGYDIEYKLSSEADDEYRDVKPAPRGTKVTGFNLTTRDGQSIVAGTSYDVRVRAKNDEGWGEWSDAGAVITAGTAPPAATPPNRAPAFVVGSIELEVAEDAAAGTAIGDAITATDPDGDTLAYSLGTTADDGHFAIDSKSGQLSVKGALDYESDASYTVTVTATDPDGISASVAVTISVTDIADTPPGKPAAPTFTAVQETSFRIKWTAPEAGSSAIDSMALQYKPSSEGEDAWADVKPVPGKITSARSVRGFNLLNRSGQHITSGTSYDVRVREGNAHGWGEWSDAGTVTTAGTAHTVPAKPAAPTFTAVQETQLRIVWKAPTPGASPITGYDIEYKLSSESDDEYRDVKPAPRGTKATGFNLTTRDGQSIVAGTSYDVRVRAENDQGWGEWSDAGTVTTAGTASPAATPPNRAPAFVVGSIELEVAEDAAAGTAIGDAITATDPDGDTLAYSLGTTADDGHFAIDSKSGQLSVKGALDYESDASYTVTVTATDPDGLSASVAVTISVIDIADTPPGKQARRATFTDVRETRFRIV